MNVLRKLACDTIWRVGVVLCAGAALGLAACQPLDPVSDPMPQVVEGASKKTPTVVLLPEEEPVDRVVVETPEAAAALLVEREKMASAPEAAQVSQVPQESLVREGPLGGESNQEHLSPEQIRNGVRAFADRYRHKVAEACDQIAAKAHDPVVGRRAMQFKIDAATAVYDIAVNPAPAQAMIDTLVMLSLQVNMAERHGASQFGEAGGVLLLDAARDLQEAAFGIAARVMTGEQREKLLGLCRAWSDEHPHETGVWYVRLNNLPGVASGDTVLDMVDSLTDLPGKFLGKFIPGVNAAGESVSEATLLAERMSWLGPRLMIVSQWRAELLIYESLAAPQVNDAVAVSQRLAKVAEDLPQQLDAQRTALFNDLIENRETLEGLLQGSLGITENTQAIMRSMDGVLARVQALKGEPNPNAVSGRPFDITEYTTALQAADATISEAHALLESAEKATAAGALEAKLGVVTGEARSLVWLAGGVLGGAVLLAGLLIVLAAKWIPGR